MTVPLSPSADFLYALLGEKECLEIGYGYEECDNHDQKKKHFGLYQGDSQSLGDQSPHQGSGERFEK